MENKEYYMRLAYLEAKKALKTGEIPVGAIIVDGDGTIIAKSYNKRNKKNDVTSHAEIEAIKKASKVKNNWRLDDCQIFVTVEPCLMCTGAIIQSRIKEINYGVKATNEEITLSDFSDYLFNNGFSIYKDIYSKKIEKQLEEFYEKIRKKI